MVGLIDKTQAGAAGNPHCLLPMTPIRKWTRPKMIASPQLDPRFGLPHGAEPVSPVRARLVASRKPETPPAGAKGLVAEQGGGGRAPKVAVPPRVDPRSTPLRLWLAGGAVVLSTALHAGLVAALVALGGAVPPLAEPDIEAAEVSLMSEAQFQAMTAPKPQLPQTVAALAMPAGLADGARAAIASEPVSLPVPETLSRPDLAMAPPAPQLPAAPEAPLATASTAEPDATLPVAEPTPTIAVEPAPKPAPAPAAKPVKPTRQPAKAEVAAKPQPAPKADAAPPTAAKSAPPPAQAVSQGEAKALKADWGSKISARLKRTLSLPDGAAPGRVKLRVTVSPKGALLSVEIVGSSGQPALDKAALRAAKAAAPYPRAPKGLNEASYSFVVPIRLDG